MAKFFTKKRLLFLALFSLLVFLADRVNFSRVVGAENQYFTLFQFFGPTAGAFLGPLFGALSVLVAELGGFFLLGKAFTAINVMRLAPMLFAAYYFGAGGKKMKYVGVVVPLLAMALFVAHPVGRQAWFFSLYWLIPVLGALRLAEKVPGRLFFRSLGATFTAHAIGSTLWLYTVPMSAAQWMGLIPVVAYERLLFAGGMAVSYVAMNTALDKVVDALKIPKTLIHIDKDYALLKRASS